MKAKLLKRIRRKWNVGIILKPYIARNTIDLTGGKPFKVDGFKKFYIATRKKKESVLIEDSDFKTFISKLRTQ